MLTVVVCWFKTAWNQTRADQTVCNATLGADEEAFEDNSEEYIRRDLEGSGKYLIHYYLPLSTLFT